MIGGQSGILSQAGSAKEKSDESELREEIAKQYRNAVLKNLKDSSQNVVSTLQSELSESSIVTSTDGTEYNMEIQYKGYKFTIQDGEIISSEKIKK